MMRRKIGNAGAGANLRAVDRGQLRTLDGPFPQNLRRTMLLGCTGDMYGNWNKDRDAGALTDLHAVGRGQLRTPYVPAQHLLHRSNVRSCGGAARMAWYKSRDAGTLAIVPALPRHLPAGPYMGAAATVIAHGPPRGHGAHAAPPTSACGG